MSWDRLFNGANESDNYDDYVSGLDYGFKATPEASQLDNWARSRGGWGAVILSIVIGILFFFLFFWLMSLSSQSLGSQQQCCPCPSPGVIPAVATAQPRAALPYQPLQVRQPAAGNCRGCAKAPAQGIQQALSRRVRRQVRLPGDRTLTGAPLRG